MTIASRAGTTMVIAALFLFAGAALWAVREAELEPSVPRGTMTPQQVTVDNLNALGASLGWKATFSYENRTLRLDGSMLCNQEFLGMIPPETKRWLVRDFEWFRCVNGNTRVVIQIKE